VSPVSATTEFIHQHLKLIIMKESGKTPRAPGIFLITGTLTLLLTILIAVNSCSKEKVPDRMDLQLVTDNLVSPIGVVPVPDDTRRMFIIEQAGKIWILTGGGQRLPDPFLDLTSRMVTLNPNFDERGVLGLAFHPNYRTNGKFYVYYNAPPRPGGPIPGTTWNNLARISEFTVSENPNLGNLNSERPLLELDDPQSNHNGGTLVFGTDGYLYISIGDGGGANDTARGHVPDWYLPNAGGNGQDIEQNLFGNILRIDVNSGNPYGIPSDNPFVGEIGKDEIYAYGFRNPYRMSFDMGGSRQLYVGDAGQKLYEEVSIVEKGGNYGWNVKEGTHCFNAADGTTFPSCPTEDNLGNPLIDPVIEMNNVQNPAGGVVTLTVIGGHVYRGNSISELNGKYIFGSFSKSGSPQGEIFMSTPRSGPGLWSFQEVPLVSYPDHLGMFVKGFGQDNQGEIYVATSTLVGPSGNTGKVFKLVKAK
jgi:glucose/arabinose dehydrogenase